MQGLPQPGHSGIALWGQIAKNAAKPSTRGHVVPILELASARGAAAQSLRATTDQRFDDAFADVAK
jgi:hypothetical protein